MKKLTKYQLANTAFVLANLSLSAAIVNAAENDIKLLTHVDFTQREKLYNQRFIKQQKQSCLFKTRDFSSKTYAYELSLLESKSFAQHLIDSNSNYNAIRDTSKDYAAITSADLRRAIRWLQKSYCHTCRLIGSLDSNFYFEVIA